MADDTHQPSEEEVTLMLKRAGLIAPARAVGEVLRRGRTT